MKNNATFLLNGLQESILEAEQKIQALTETLNAAKAEVKSNVRRSNSKETTKLWRAKKRGIPLTLEYLRTVLSYDPDAGLFTWLIRRHGYGGYVNPGDIAGTLKTGKGGGYILIVVDQHNFRAHRLAWWFMTGEQAPRSLDVEHKNQKRADNKWSNLKGSQREAKTMPIWACDPPTPQGTKGVHRVSNGYGKPYFARITVEGKIIHLGCFDTIEEASEARRIAEIKYQGEFRNTYAIA